jgi:hypothetical protein
VSALREKVKNSCDAYKRPEVLSLGQDIPGADASLPAPAGSTPGAARRSSPPSNNPLAVSITIFGNRVKLARPTFHGAVAHSHLNPTCRVNTSESEKIFHFFSLSADTLAPQMNL